LQNSAKPFDFTARNEANRRSQNGITLNKSAHK
jgi:hypothetical protein